MKIVSSILTGFPVQTRMGNKITEAGLQQRKWCHMLLAEMGDNNFIEKEILGFKRKITKNEVEEHIKNI